MTAMHGPRPRMAVPAAFAGLSLACGIALAAAPQGFPDWAFPGAGEPPAPPTKAAESAPVSVPGSRQRYTQAQLHDHNFPLDWWPDGHPAAPPIVARGRAPSVLPCGLCHYQNGVGRPDSAALAGLPAGYIVAQVAAFRGGARGNVRSHWGPVDLMRAAAATSPNADVAAAARYFAKLPFRSPVRVVEASQIPAMTVAHNVYRPLPGHARERLGDRIVETPARFDRFLLRDSGLAYVAYVPPGAIARGRVLAGGGARGGAPCGACHGAALAGAMGPPLAGRSPSYLFRQLHGFKSGDRRGGDAETMKAVVARLSLRDMIDLAAFIGAQKLIPASHN